MSQVETLGEFIIFYFYYGNIFPENYNNIIRMNIQACTNELSKTMKRQLANIQIIILHIECLPLCTTLN